MKFKQFQKHMMMATIGLPLLVVGQVQLNEALVLSHSSVKEGVKADAIQARFRELNKKSGNARVHLFKADRGKSKGDFLIAFSGEAKSKGGPFNEMGDILNAPSSFTEYKLIGAKTFPSLPKAGILGIHYIKVKENQADAFEKFVTDKLNPVVGKLLPDMQMLYYKGSAGQQAGSYITIFTIESVAARDKYWPEGSETEKLKETFRPLKSLALELSAFLEEGSFLKPESGGAAAYFESLNWTDFILQP